MKRVALLCGLLVLAMSPFAPASAQSKKSQAKSHHATGVVKSVNADKGTVTVDHGPVSSMNWPAMSMSFKAKDKKTLQGLKPGAKIEFDFEQRGKDYVIMQVK